MFSIDVMIMVALTNMNVFYRCNDDDSFHGYVCFQLML